MSESSLAAGSSKAPIDYRNRQGWFSNSVLEFLFAKHYLLDSDLIPRLLKTFKSTVCSPASKQKTGYLVSSKTA